MKREEKASRSNDGKKNILKQKQGEKGKSETSPLSGLKVGEIFEALKKNYESLNKQYTNAIQQIFKHSYLPKLIELKKEISIQLSTFAENFRQLKEIDESEVVRILKKYGWLINPSLPYNFLLRVTELKEKGQENRKTIDKLFVDYFSANNFAALETLIKNWGKIPFLNQE